jgi:hypothetical protein
MKGGVLHISDILQLEKFEFDKENPVYKSALDTFLFNDANYIDYDWIRQQIAYIDGLSERQKHVLRAYTIYGDRFVNKYIRNSLTQADIRALIANMIAHGEDVFKYQQIDAVGVPLTDASYPLSVLSYIPQFINELNAIIRSSPSLTRPIKVFRGIKNRNHYDAIASNGTMTYNEFISTSMYLPSAMSDAFVGPTCCVLEMTLRPGTPCIFTARISRRRNEFEITLAVGTRHTVVNPTTKFALDDMDHYVDADIFMNPKDNAIRQMTTVELRSIP